MSLAFKYRVTHDSSLGNVTTSRFVNARSAFEWVRRLSSENTPYKIESLDENEQPKKVMNFADLKKETGAVTPVRKKKRAKSANKRK